MRRKPLAPLTPEQQQLAADNERLIYLAIHRYAPDEDADELYGHAAEGLLRAASTYDPTRGKFSTHAMWCIRSEIAHRKKYAQQRKRSGMLILYTDDNDTAFDSAGKYDHTQRGAVKPKDRPHFQSAGVGDDVLVDLFAAFCHAKRLGTKLCHCARLLIIWFTPSRRTPECIFHNYDYIIVSHACGQNFLELTANILGDFLVVLQKENPHGALHEDFFVCRGIYACALEIGRASCRERV